MKTTLFIIMVVIAFCARAQSNAMISIASPAPQWSVVQPPQEWPQEADGSNSILRCIAFVESEIQKARSYLLTRSYRILEGGLKRASPHIIVPYSEAVNDSWTIFFVKETLVPYSVKRHGSSDNQYLIQLDPNNGLLKNFSSTKAHISCTPPGKLSSIAFPIRDELTYTLVWDENGHLETEKVYDWSKRGKVITK